MIGDDRRGASQAAGRPTAGRLADPRAYRLLLEHVVSQLRGQLSAAPPAEAGALVLIPAVGFGEQSRNVLERTLQLLAAQHSPTAPITTVVLVNRPSARAPDSTEARVRAWAARAGLLAASRPAEDRARVPLTVAIASLEVPHTPRLGELRQLLLEATMLLLPLNPRSTTLVVADDDLVAAPPSYVHRLCAYLERHPHVDLALGPLLFDDERFPTPLLAELFVGDLLRALLAARFTDYLAHLDLARMEHRETLERLSQRYFESIILSGNLGVRVSAIEPAGGFRDFNEITNLMRDVQGVGLAQRGRWDRTVGHSNNNVGSLWTFDAGSGDVVEALRASAVRVSSRRALAAYLSGRHPAVAQWQACRFRADRVDPVRVHEPAPFAALPVRAMQSAQLEAAVQGIETSIRTTLRYFPPHRAIVAEVLRALGLGPDRCALEGPDERDQGWSVRIRHPGALLEQVVAAQDEILARHGRSLDRPVLLPLDEAASSAEAPVGEARAAALAGRVAGEGHVSYHGSRNGVSRGDAMAGASGARASTVAPSGRP